MIRFDSEAKIACATCGRDAWIREVFVATETQANKITYESHGASIDSEEHLATLRAIDEFYTPIFAAIDDFKARAEEARTVRVGEIAGLLVDLGFGSIRTPACEPRTIIVPTFDLRTFGRVYEITLAPRELSSLNLDELLGDVIPRAQPLIESAKARRDSGLE